ncbi:MAG: NifU family protein [Actinocatenispora sp.]
MTAPNDARDARTVGEHIDRLLTDLDRVADPTVRRTTEDLVRSLVEFYGSGLARVVALLSDLDGGAATLAGLAADQQIRALLILHDLHPDSTAERVAAALAKVRPYLGSHAGGVELLGVDDGVVRLRLEGNCDGCPSSTVTVKLAIEQAIDELAPEVTRVEVEGVVEPPAPTQVGPGGRPLLPLRPLSGPESVAAETPPAEPATWIDVTEPAVPRPGAMTAARLGGQDTVICRVGEDLYAYRDHCPACRGRLSGGRLDGALLACQHCGHRYDLRRAGAGDGVHLDPFPLLADAGAVRVAVPGLVAS